MTEQRLVSAWRRKVRVGFGDPGLAAQTFGRLKSGTLETPDLALVVKGNPPPQLIPGPRSDKRMSTGDFFVYRGKILHIMGNELERSELDRLLLSEARNPANSIVDIADATGLTPEQAANRLSELYSEKGALTDLYRERQLLEDVYSIYEEIKKRAENASERNQAGLYNALRQMIALMFDRLEKARNQNKADINTISELHARVMIDAVSLTFEKALFELQKRYPEIERDELTEIVEQALPLALTEIGQK